MFFVLHFPVILCTIKTSLPPPLNRLADYEDQILGSRPFPQVRPGNVARADCQAVHPDHESQQNNLCPGFLFFLSWNCQELPAERMPFQSQRSSPRHLQRINPSEANINTFFFFSPPKSCYQNQLAALTDDTAHPGTSMRTPLAAERREKCAPKWRITLSEKCSNLFWRISPNSDFFHPVLASHSAMANPICCAYFSPPPQPPPQPRFLPCFLSRALPERARKEVSQTGPLLMCSQERSLPFISVPSSRATLIRQSIGVWRFNTDVPAGRLSWRGAAGDTL